MAVQKLMSNARHKQLEKGLMFGLKHAKFITIDIQDFKIKIVQTKSYSTPIVWTENYKLVIIGCWT